MVSFSYVAFSMSCKCSEDQLLSTSPSSSTLSLLICNFGIEASSSLHEINLSNGVLKLSGYVSGPSDGISMKVCHFFDHNLVTVYLCYIFAFCAYALQLFKDPSFL